MILMIFRRGRDPDFSVSSRRQTHKRVIDLVRDNRKDGLSGKYGGIEGPVKEVLCHVHNRNVSSGRTEMN